MLLGRDADEISDNARYAMQYQFALYERIPRAVRAALIEPVLLGLPGTAKVPLVRKARSYVKQALTPMPDRYEAYNLLERVGPENVFDPELAHRDPGCRHGFPKNRQHVYGQVTRAPRNRPRSA